MLRGGAGDELVSAAELLVPSRGLRGLSGPRIPVPLGPDSSGADSSGGVMGIAAAASASAPEFDGDSGSWPLGARATMCATCATVRGHP